MDIQKHIEKTVVPSRTRYQLENFVIGQHDTPQMRWRQIILEAQDLSYKIRSAELSIQKSELEKLRLLETGDAIDVLDAEQKAMDIEMTRRTLEGAYLELQWLQEIAERNGPYTIDEIEENQQEYWILRLQRQADTDVLSAQKNISPSNIQSMLNAGMIFYKEDKCVTLPGNSLG